MSFKKNRPGKRMTKLQRSNAAHQRLRDKHKTGFFKRDPNSIVKYIYHGNVGLEQKRLGRVLSLSEKKDEYANARETSRIYRKF